MPISAAFGCLPTFKMPPPGLLRGVTDPSESSYVGTQIDVKDLRAPDTAEWRHFSTPTFSSDTNVDIDSYGLLLAKIAHCAAVASYGVHGFEAWLPPFILGEESHWSFLVGGAEGDVVPREVLHEITPMLQPLSNAHLYDQYLVMVKIRLFSQWGGPHALILAGSTNDDVLAATAEPS